MKNQETGGILPPVLLFRILLIPGHFSAGLSSVFVDQAEGVAFEVDIRTYGAVGSIGIRIRMYISALIQCKYGKLTSGFDEL